ncbi:hypothetical protein ACFQJ7_05255 [Halovenus rubra]|uniref:Uncharacterized protein n=2 Tax=Halovenus rubra TaxID=869890 RepID=A0ACC7DXK1_9EURY|nr:hypothetical protein [Halovenus rubra]
MTSLDEAYSQDWTGDRNPRRVVGGLALVGAGIVAVMIAMVLVGLQGDSTVAKRYGGVIAGLGIPALLLGVVVVLPASNRTRLGVVFGTVIASTGVFLFWNVYPDRWTRTAEPLAFETTMLYGVGCVVALAFVFSAIASFRLRNNPQGTVRLEVVRQGETRTVEVSNEQYRQMVNDGGQAEQLLREIEDQ